jgi:hypothetical protein
LVQAVLDLLLEDPTFLKLFGWVESFNVEKEDMPAGKDGIRFDALFFRIELEFASSQIRHTPKVPATAAPIQTAEVQTTTGDAVVESQIPLPQ